MSGKLKGFHEKTLGLYGFIGFLILWELAPRIGLADQQFIKPPSIILETAWKLAITGDLFIHMATSLQRTLLGLLLAICTAVPLGFILGGWFPKVTRFLSPLLSILGQINAFSLFPIFILLFGIGEVAKLSIIYWSSIWPVFFTTVAGIQNVDPVIIKGARSMGASRATIFFKVILPGASRSIFTAIRAGTTTAFLMLIAAEMLASSAGLGWLIHNSNMNGVIDRLFVAAVTIALLNMGIVYLISQLENTLIVWKEDVKTE